ncbi:hypothetical protein T4C_13467 [Trichinella pseudospiralis]|uniref:Uncharacterized protein n=1 Tax=Trichinella pseudospiralis TaxID=6337 RepID=A0A0V1K7C9_TRIPS|nr:hypothetical protein T4C_13467 [Trichinella pseudospiralis]
MYVLNSITHGSDNSGAQRRIRSLTCLTLHPTFVAKANQKKKKRTGKMEESKEETDNPREDVNQHSAPGILARIRNKAHVRPTRPAFQSLGGKQAGD